MNSLNTAHLAKIYYQERLREAERRRRWSTSKWVRDLPKLAQIVVMVLL